MSETYECDNCGEDVPATVGGEGLHKCSECVPISELEDLIEEWENQKEYRDTRSVANDLQELIDDHRE